jgi:hypothetical protein
MKAPIVAVLLFFASSAPVELEHLVSAKVRHEYKAVGVVGADGMRVARRRDDLERSPTQPSGPTGLTPTTVGLSLP